MQCVLKERKKRKQVKARRIIERENKERKLKIQGGRLGNDGTGFALLCRSRVSVNGKGEENTGDGVVRFAQ